LDVSTKTIGVALLKNVGTSGELKLLTHVTPKVKPKPKSKLKELFEKVRIFESDFLNEYSSFNITRVIIEEPLLRSNNVNTVGTLLRFNGMVARSVYETLNIVPEFISSYDSRKYAFPELMAIRKFNKKGEAYSEKHIAKAKEVLFGGYSFDIDKKEVVWEKTADLEPKVDWIYKANTKVLTKENFDMADAYACVRGYMRKEGLWD
jgi:hypothetical protein